MSAHWQAPADFLDTINGNDAQAEIEKLIEAIPSINNRADKKIAQLKLAALMSDYNEEVGFFAYDENKGNYILN